MSDLLSQVLGVSKATVTTGLSVLSSYIPEPINKPKFIPPPPREAMNLIRTSPWVSVAAISGAAAVVLGAYGAHGKFPEAFVLSNS